MAAPSNWQRVWEIFEGALEQPENRRAAWVDEACAGDIDLHQQVTRLIAAHGKAGGLLDSNVATLASQALTTPEPASSDEQIGPYRVIGEIGRGGMAVVYKAEDPRLGRYVALKFVSPNLIASHQGKQRMMSEARAASRLDHPNICTIYDIGETPDGRLYLAMAYYEGQTLANRLMDGPLPVDEALTITTQIARALDHAHEATVIHRDIKPSNVFLTNRGEVKVLDFGLAKLGGLSITETGAQLGTVYYVSPEQARGKEVDSRTDLWSLGATVYEMLTGRTPFAGEDAVGVLYNIVHEEPRALGPGVPPQVGRIVRKLLAKNRGARYTTARELLRDLGASVSTISGSDWSTAASPRRKWLTWVGVGGAAALVLVLAGVSVYKREPAARHANTPPPVPLTSFPGREELASFSPDGSQVAFSWDGQSQDNFDIYIKLTDSPTALRLTDHAGWDSSPAWSPKGNQIAFLRERPEGGVEIRITTSIGGPERLVATASCGVRSGLSWSPDGEHILVADRPSAHATPEVAAIRVSSGEKQVLARAPEGSVEVRSPSYSPDGMSVAFDAVRLAGLGDTYVSTKGSVKRLTSSGGDPEGLAWTRDGRYILFGRVSSAGRRTMASVSASRGVVEPVSLGDNPSQPVLAKLGDRLAFSKRLTLYGIVRIDPTGRDKTVPFVSSTRFDATPHFSPDGSKVAFASGRSGDVETWICDTKGANLRQLTRLGTTGSPRWSPDGRYIVFDAIVDGNADIYVVPAEGGPIRRVTTKEAEDVVPSWSTDGKWIYFASLRTGKLEVWKVAADSGEPASTAVQVTTEGGFHAIESPDGKVLYYSKSRNVDNAIWQKPVSGGPEQPLIEGVGSGWGNWHVGPQGIYFVNTRGPSKMYFDRDWSVYLFHLPGRSVSEVARLEHTPTRGGEGLGVSPDGRLILFGHVVIESDLMLVDGFR